MNLFVRSVPGRIIKMPERGFMTVPEEGVEVADSSYYRRAIQDGDIELYEPDVPETKPEPVKAAPAVLAISLDEPKNPTEGG